MIPRVGGGLIGVTSLAYEFTRVDNLRCTLCLLDLACNPPNCPKQKRIGSQLITPEASFLLL